MSIVLKENDWAEEMIRNSELGKKPSETLQRVARYYLDSGYSNAATRNKLDMFLVQCDPTASLPKWSSALDYALKRATKFKAVDIDYIGVSGTEMETIDCLKSVQERRLAFTLLCLSKYWNAVNPQMDSWVTNKDAEIMRMANISTSLKRRSAMYFDMRELGLLQFSKRVDNTNVRVLYADNNEPVINVTDFRNLGYQYMMYHGGDFFICENCGIVTKRNNENHRRPPKYCKDCAAKIKTKQHVESTMRRRYKTADGLDENKDVFTVYVHMSPNNKKYVGFTSRFPNKRWQGGSGYKHNSRFYADIIKYGWENIKHYIIAVVQDVKTARDIESYYIQKFKTCNKRLGYNSQSGEYARVIDYDVASLCTFTLVDGVGRKTCTAAEA